MKFVKILSFFSGVFFAALSLEGYTLDWSDYAEDQLNDWDSNTANGASFKKKSYENKHFLTSSQLTMSNVDNSGLDVFIEIKTTHMPEDFSGKDPDFIGVNNDKFTGAANNESEDDRHSLYLLLNNHEAHTDSDSRDGDEIKIMVKFYESGTKTEAAVTNVSFDLFDVDAQSGLQEVVYNFSANDRKAEDYGDLDLNLDLDVDSVVTKHDGYVKYDEDEMHLIGHDEVINSQDHKSSGAAGTEADFANATIDFGGQIVSDYQFYYKSLGADKEVGFGLYDINFDLVTAPAVPEYGVFHALFLVGGIVFIYKRRKEKASGSEGISHEL